MADKSLEDYLKNITDQEKENTSQNEIPKFQSELVMEQELPKFGFEFEYFEKKKKVKDK
ncbi:hypothetical protein [Domibacillus tundrae]|uniref:hypothetical protein n=1 Tax=Domibacillus tundrae TaxID=1587527 RepID=UPI000B28234B|nr:hypothetical protein [Domibacillus tundrae]